jgi:hypothetical protein
MHSQKKNGSILKGTKDGALYIIAKDLFATKDVQDLVLRLQESSIRKKILAYKRST